MAEENKEDTLEDPLGPDTNDKKSDEDSPTEKPQKKEYSDLEKRLYARAKKAEERAKQLESELSNKAKAPATDLDAILEATTATAGLELDEISELKLRASALGVSLTEARKDKIFNLTLDALREEKRKASAPEPSSRETGAADKVPLKEQTFAEKEEFLRNLKLNGQSVNLLPKWGNPASPKPRA